MPTEEDPLVRLRKVVEAGLETLSQSPAFRRLLDLAQDHERQQAAEGEMADTDGFKTVFITGDTVLSANLGNPKTAVEVERLRNVLSNAAKHSSVIYDYFNDELAHDAITVQTVMRLAVTMRDSLDQMAALLRGEDLDDDYVPQAWEMIDIESLHGKILAAEAYQELRVVESAIRGMAQDGSLDHDKAEGARQVLDRAKLILRNDQGGQHA